MTITGTGFAPTILGLTNPAEKKTGVTFKCNFCDNQKTVVVDDADLARWDMGRGEYVQTCFPYLSPGDRELFISGVCGECFDDMFPAEEEGDL